MKELINALYPMNACLLGEGYDSRLEYIKHLINLDVIEFPSGTKLETWTVPEEWIVRDAWVKFNGEKIIDYSKNPLSLIVGSLPVNKTMKLEELKSHLQYSETFPKATPYGYKFYDKDWGFCLPQIQYMHLEEGEYEVFVDTEYKSGVMKLGVHTIPGKSDREILLFAHLDHPFQANDNLSGVACLVDLARKIKCDHTIKIILCPETIGSTAYALTQDISKVDFVIAVDICGNDNTLMLNKTYDREHNLNRVAHLAIQGTGDGYRKTEFRAVIGSDESVFNDPLIGIPGLMLSRHPYNEYHTSDDKPDIINYDMIEQTQKIILAIIDIWEKDYIPKREFKGLLMRSAYGFQTSNKQLNLAYDYFFYAMDGKKSLVELCSDLGMHFQTTYDILEKLINDKKVSRVTPVQAPQRKIARKKHKRV